MLSELTSGEKALVKKHFNLTLGSEPPLAIWLIGRPAAGKTSTATILKNVLIESGHRVELLDGDFVRSILHEPFGYTVNERMTVTEKYIQINRFFQKHRIIVITSAVIGSRECQDLVRDNLENVKLVYLDCPFRVAADRDKKGMYSKALSGQLKNFYDVDIPFESPISYEMKIDSQAFKPHEIVSKIVDHFYETSILVKPQQNNGYSINQ